MLDNLNEMDRKLELRDPTTRAIIKTYWDSEVEKLDTAVYKPLEKRFPSLKGILKIMREQKDPIDVMEKQKSEVDQLKLVSSLVGLVEIFLEGEDEDTKAIKIMMEKIKPVCDLYEKYSEMTEKFYVAIAKSVKDIALIKGIKPEDVTKNQGYMGEVMRKVFPTRDEAEDYLKTSQKFGTEMVDVGKGFIAFAKKSGQADEKLLEAEKLIPTKKAFEIIKKETLEYKTKEFDRIYSQTE